MTDICDDIREDCLNGKEGDGLCVCSLAKCIESSLLEWIFIRTSSEPNVPGLESEESSRADTRRCRLGDFSFLFFFFQEKNPSFGEDGVWIRNYRLLVSRSYIKSCIEGEVWNYDGCG